MIHRTDKPEPGSLFAPVVEVKPPSYASLKYEAKPGLCRADGSPTMRAAAESVASVTGAKRRAVLEALRDAGALGMTDQEIELATGISGNCVRPRRVELVDAGAVKAAGFTRNTTSGRAASVWIAVEESNSAN